VLIVSRATVKPMSDAGEAAIATELKDLKLSVSASPHAKCERCWHHRDDIGQEPTHPGLCVRCVENISGEGEQRAFA
jgi:isoleucyl-tRNA synthetase